MSQGAFPKGYVKIGHLHACKKRVKELGKAERNLFLCKRNKVAVENQNG